MDLEVDDADGTYFGRLFVVTRVDMKNAHAFSSVDVVETTSTIETLRIILRI
jgi:hypothetical protein